MHLVYSSPFLFFPIPPPTPLSINQYCTLDYYLLCYTYSFSFCISSSISNSSKLFFLLFSFSFYASPSFCISFSSFSPSSFFSFSVSFSHSLPPPPLCYFLLLFFKFLCLIVPNENVSAVNKRVHAILLCRWLRNFQHEENQTLKEQTPREVSIEIKHREKQAANSERSNIRI